MAQTVSRTVFVFDPLDPGAGVEPTQPPTHKRSTQPLDHCRWRLQCHTDYNNYLVSNLHRGTY